MSPTATSVDQDAVALCRKVSEAVNDRRYDDLDALFAPDFVDHNPAWDVDSLPALKQLIKGAQEALDFRAGLDALYPADGGRVVMQITFTGRHVKPIFGIEPTGRPVSWTNIEVYRVENNLVAERWVQADTAGLMRQIGAGADATREVVDRYYELANTGQWDAWCDLFSADTRMDEQLAGHVEGRESLREMMKGFPQTYASFANEPRHVVVSDSHAAVVSHISGKTRHGAAVEADVCNYFEVSDGHITYMANFHDTVPFGPVLSGR